jgi:hypothetical protein
MIKQMLILVFAGTAFAGSRALERQPDNKVCLTKTTYNVDVLPLIQLKCGPCHLRSKGGVKANFENYKTAKKNGAEMLERIQLPESKKKYMPTKNARLNAEEIAVFKKWVDDGLLEK